MSKKKNPSASRKAKQGHPARSAAAGQIVSIDEFRARSTGDDVSAGFMKWVRANTSLLAIGDPLTVLHGFLEQYRRRGGSTDTTILQESPTTATLAWYLAEDTDNDPGFVLHVVLAYLLFLDDSDLWSGSDEQYEAVKAAILESVDAESDAEFDDRIFVVPALTRKQNKEALLALPLAGHLQAFLAWFGEKRDITSTGALTRKDIEGAAAALGINALGVASNPTEAFPADGEPLRVTRAQDVPGLALFWDALQRAGFIELGSKRATLSPGLAPAAGQEHEEALMQLTRDVAAAMYQSVILMAGSEGPDDEGPDLASLLTSSMLLEAGMDEGLPVASADLDLGRGSEAQVDLLIAQLAMNLLAAEGLVEVEGHYRIPPALVKLIAIVLAEPAGLEIDFEDPRDEEPDYLGATN